MVPGNLRFWYWSPRLSWARATVGTACWFVHCTSSRLLLARLMMPPAATRPGITRAATPTIRSLRRLGLLIASEDIVLSNWIRFASARQQPVATAWPFGGRGHARG